MCSLARVLPVDEKNTKYKATLAWAAWVLIGLRGCTGWFKFFFFLYVLLLFYACSGQGLIIILTDYYEQWVPRSECVPIRQDKRMVMSISSLCVYGPLIFHLLSIGLISFELQN